MLHHLSIAVTDLHRSTTFYDAVLQTLGYDQVWCDKTAVGYGLKGGGDKFEMALKFRTLAKRFFQTAPATDSRSTSAS